MENMERNIEKIIQRALQSWEYSISAAEHMIREYKEKKEPSDLIMALLDAHEVISATSTNSIYDTLLDVSGFRWKYKTKFTELWGRAKQVKFAALPEIDNLLEKKKKR